jgi:hypothetical protein
MTIRRLLPLFAAGSLLLTACEKDDHDHNHIEIEFLEPTNDQTVSDASDVHIHVRFTADEENHNVALVLHPEGDASDVILELDQHDHDQVVDLEADVDLSGYPAGTEFHLEAEACEDHDCAEVVTADIHFSIP